MPTKRNEYIKPAEQRDENQSRKIYVGPWENVEEFKLVYEYLYGETATQATRQLAYDAMRIWKMRRRAQCPAAILATSVLLRVQLLREANGDSNKALTTIDYQELYAFALIRFFNFMSSTMQTSANNLRTMYDTARQLDLPTIVVDLRHLCAHGSELPPLKVLARINSSCLEWLKRYYWDLHVTTMRNVHANELQSPVMVGVAEKVQKLFKIYDIALECYLKKGGHNLKTSKSLVTGKRLAALKEFCTERQQYNLRPIFDDVVRELKSIVNRCRRDNVPTVEWQTVIVKTLINMKWLYTLAATQKNWPGLLDVTQTLVSWLATNDLLDDFLLQLFVSVEQRRTFKDAADRVHSRGVCVWLREIINGLLAYKTLREKSHVELNANPQFEKDIMKFNRSQISNRLRSVFIYSMIDYQHVLIFRPANYEFDCDYLKERLDAINNFTAPILTAMLPLVVGMTADEMKAINAIITIYTNTSSGVGDDSTVKGSKTVSASQDIDKIYTANDLFAFIGDGDEDEDDTPWNEENVGEHGDAEKDDDVVMKPQNAKINDKQKKNNRTTATTNKRSAERQVDEAALHPRKSIRHDFDDDDYDSDGNRMRYGSSRIIPVDPLHDWSQCPLGMLPWQ